MTATQTVDGMWTARRESNPPFNNYYKKILSRESGEAGRRDNPCGFTSRAHENITVVPAKAGIRYSMSFDYLRKYVVR
jgi:hypothetical protein